MNKKEKKTKKTKKKTEEESEDEKEESKPTKKPRKKSKEPKSTKKTKKSKSRSSSRKSKSNSGDEEEISTSNKKKGRQLSLEESFAAAEREEEENNNYPTMPEDKESLKIICWNVSGFRTTKESGELKTLIDKEDPDIICFNEVKADLEKIKKEKFGDSFSETYKTIWHCADERKGYSGTAIFTKYKPNEIKMGKELFEEDDEGRVISIEYDKFILVCCYTPNAGEGLKRLDYRVDTWDSKFFELMSGLKEKNKNIIICGDLNVANEEIDIYETKGHNNSPGFTKKERDSFKEFLEMGFKDTFRDLHPEEEKYSFFTKRGNAMKANNKGWRLDYFLTGDEFEYNITNSDMLDKDDYDSSDHIPLIFEFEFKE
ncbi:MAG: exodeoxyribonuclease III [archaeon]|nr:exodeoxyribonuclease III [archaeon]